MAGVRREAHDRYEPRDIRPDKEQVFGDYKPGEGGDGPLKFLRWLPEMRLLCVCAAGTFGLFPPFPRQQALRLPPKPVYTDALEVTDAENLDDDVSDDAEEEEAELHTYLKDAGVSCLDVAFAPVRCGVFVTRHRCEADTHPLSQHRATNYNSPLLDLTLRFYHCCSSVPE